MTPASTTTPALSYLALGDSYTIGEGVAPADRWPVQLATRLRADGIALADPRIIATTGWTTGELDAAIDAAMDAARDAASEPAPDEATGIAPLLQRFDFASLQIGVNDQYRGHALEAFRTGFTALLARAIGFTGGRADRVLVLSIPDWGVTRFGAASGRDRAAIAREIDAFNVAARAACDARGVAFIDITGLSRTHGARDAMLVDDGLHPSPAMYAAWTDAALPVARGLLAR